MTANAIMRELRKGPTTYEGLELRLKVAGDKVEHLQLMLDGLLLMGDVKLTHTPTTNFWWYALTKEPEWHPEDACAMVETLSKHPEKKLDWNQPRKFVLNPLAEHKPKPRVEITEKMILDVLEHDAPSAIKIVQRLTNLLRLKPFEINFYDVKMLLNEMLEKGTVGYIKPIEMRTEIIPGGWFKPRNGVA